MLFENFEIKNVKLKNRVVVSPMCQYSAKDGYSQDHHRVHYGQMAMGGAGLVFLEATAVTSQGRITNGCLGIWKDDFLEGLSELARIIENFGSTPAIQLAHAGQKGSMQRPWHGNGPQSNTDIERGDVIWEPIAPSSKPLDKGWLKPRKMESVDLVEIKRAFVLGAERALKAGFKVLEVHMAHGYLLHSFLSPISNLRNDEYGGSIENRMRYPLEVVKAVREKIGVKIPLFVRISSEDGLEGGWTLDDSVIFCSELKKLDVDIIDCSSGGNSPKGATASGQKKEMGFQVPFAARIKKEVGISTQAVGLITNYKYANSILENGLADLIALGRQHLFDPFWTNHAREEANQNDEFKEWPQQYKWWLEKWKKALENNNEKP